MQVCLALYGGSKFLAPGNCLKVAKIFGAEYTFSKPVKIDELLGAVDKLLQSGDDSPKTNT